ncbi:MAG: cyanophycin synthetase, partial [bacterium]
VKEYEGSKLRSLIVKKDGVTYFIDCYNANPDSMKAALKSISEQKTSGRKVAVLGDMLELDLLSDELHYEIGYFAGLKGFDMVFAYGNYSQKYAEGFIDAVGNVKNISLYNFGDVQKLKKDLNAFLKNGDLVIIKGSRGMKLEEILSV